MTVRPLALLDVDGVLGALMHPLRPPYREVGVGHRSIYADLPVAARLAELHHQQRLELMWCTTWGADADRYLAGPLGLPRGLRVLDQHHGTATGGVWWKALAVADIRMEFPGRPLLWMDDDIGCMHAEDRAALADALAPLGLALVSPHTEVGLTSGHLAAIEAWLDDGARDGLTIVGAPPIL